MSRKYQSTGLNKNFGNFIKNLEIWSGNPWRKYSLLLIIFLASFALGSSVGMINGVLALMDPIGAFFTVSILEVMVRIRQSWPRNNRSSIALKILDSSRIGLIYGLFMEGFKLF